MCLEQLLEGLGFILPFSAPHNWDTLELLGQTGNIRFEDPKVFTSLNTNKYNTNNENNDNSDNNNNNMSLGCLSRVQMVK